MPTLSEILRTKVLPWSQQNAAERFIVGRSKMSPAKMPDGTQLKRRKITEKRIISKNQRNYNNTRNVAAHWPEAGLNEVNKYKLACVLDGYVDYQLGDNALFCGPGNFIFIPPGMPHPNGSRSYVDTSKSTFCEVLFFLLHADAIECWINHRDEHSMRLVGKYLILHERVVQLFHALLEEVNSNEQNSLLIAAGLLPVCILALQREADAGRMQTVRSNAPRWPHESRSGIDPHADFATRLKSYMQTNLQKGLTMEKVAKEMYLSRAQFARVVRRETGLSFNALLTDYRIEEAKRLLSDSHWTVTTIGYFVGFKSSSYFRTFFQKNTGKTPTEYREQITKISKRKI